MTAAFFWRNRRGAFGHNHGLRIDLILASKALGLHCRGAFVDREPRGWERPTDHTPAVAEFDLP